MSSLKRWIKGGSVIGWSSYATALEMPNLWNEIECEEQNRSEDLKSAEILSGSSCLRYPHPQIQFEGWMSG